MLRSPARSRSSRKLYCATNRLERWIPKPACSLLEAIEKINRELGTTTALITHNRAIAGMADRVMRFADGRIVETTVNVRRLPPRSLEW